MRNFCFIIFFVFCTNLLLVAQITALRFTGEDRNHSYVRLDKVLIINYTQDWAETIFYPDTLLILNNGTGITTLDEASTSFSDMVPNPSYGISDINVQVVKEEQVQLSIFDVQGKKISELQQLLPVGKHTFRVYLSTPQLYLLKLTMDDIQHTFKIINISNGGQDRIEYHSANSEYPMVYEAEQGKGSSQNPFNIGDNMGYLGYVTRNGVEFMSVPIGQIQNQSEHFTLLFDTILPNCLPVTDIDGNTYQVVLLGSQCWMRENLRVTKFATGTSITLGSSTSSSTPYRYYPNDNSSNVSTYGYLYNWPAAMNGADSSSSNPSGIQGVCPNGWHLPSDAEWTQLTDYVSSQSSYLCNADASYIAKALASTSGWDSDESICTVGNNPSNNNASDFSVFPAGVYSYYGTYNGFGGCAYLWSTTETIGTEVSSRGLLCNIATVVRNEDYKNYGFSVRCLRDQ